jgi:hypothetical protein
MRGENYSMIVDKNYCLNLFRRADRKEQAQAEFNKLGLDVEFIGAVDGLNLSINEHGLLGGYQAQNLTLINILDDAISKGYEYIRLFEDDVVFTDDHAQVYADNIDFVPDFFTVLYMGCLTVNGISMPLIKGRIKKVRVACLLHDVIVKKTIFKLWRDKLAEMQLPADVALMSIYRNALDEDNNHTFKAYCFSKGISSQREGFSDNLRHIIPSIEVD